MWDLPCLLGKEAKQKCDYLTSLLYIPPTISYLELHKKENQVCGFWCEGNMYSAFDNSTGDINVEEFTNLAEAYLWCTCQI
jgi:hypothetical protein